VSNYSEVFSEFTSIMYTSLGLPLGMLLGLGFALAFIQAVTQVQDQILSFVPKTFFLCGLIALSGSVGFNQIVSFLTNILIGIRHIH
jgi:flagellar biosynthesis protein FliQ